MPHEHHFSCTFGNGFVTVKVRGQTSVLVGRILGREIKDGYEIVHTDRILLPENRHEGQDGWMAEGCFSTVFIRPMKAANEKNLTI